MDTASRNTRKFKICQLIPSRRVGREEVIPATRANGD